MVFTQFPWTYTAGFFPYSWTVSLAANGTNTDEEKLDASGDFVAVKTIASVYQDVAARTPVDYPDILVHVMDSGGRMYSTKEGIPLRHMFGHPQEPIYFEPLQIFKAGTNLRIDFANQSNVALIVRCTMIGFLRK